MEDFASLAYDKTKLLSLFLTASDEERAKQFLLVADAARLVRSSPRTIRQWIQEDKIAAITVGLRKQFVYRPSLQRFLEQVQDRE